MNENESTTKIIIRIAIIASLYVALTLSLSWLSYGDIQFRIAEILVLLCFFRKDYAYSIIIGCAIANFFSPMGIIDVIIGTIATSITVLFVANSKHLIIASIYPIIFNSIIIGFELYFMMNISIIISIISVMIGETLVMIIGYLLFKTLKNDKVFIDLIKADQNIGHAK